MEVIKNLGLISRENGFQPKKCVYGSPRETIVKCLFCKTRTHEIETPETGVKNLVCIWREDDSERLLLLL